MLLLLFFIFIGNAKLIYIFAMIRHGVLYPKEDLYANNITSQHKAELTPTGMRQLFNLGRYLKDEYMNKKGFIPKRFNHSQVQFYSSSLQRTQLSTYNLIYGLYPLKEGEKIQFNCSQDFLEPPYTPLFPRYLLTQQQRSSFALKQGFQPLPVHPLDHILDSCFKFNQFDNERQKQMKDDRARAYMENQILIHKMKLLFKLTPKDASISGMTNLYRSIQSDRMIGIAPPEDYTEEDDKMLKFIYEYDNAFYYEGKFGRLLVTLPFGLMREKLSEASSGQSAIKMTFVVYHSSNMWPILVYLNLTSSQCISQRKNNILPPKSICEIPYYASSLFVELHEDDQNSKHIVKIKFNGKYVSVCGRNQETCPFEQFVERVKNTEGDFDAQCGPRPGKDFITKKK